MRSISALLTCALVGVLACSSDKTTGPSEVDISGNWDLTQTGINFSDVVGVTCTLTSTMSLSQSAASLTGTFGPMNAICGNGAESATQTFSGGSIVNGSRSGSSVTFYLNSSNWAMVGGVGTQNAMSGDVTIAFSDGTSASGKWTATRRGTTAAIAASPRSGETLPDLAGLEGWVKRGVR